MIANTGPRIHIGTAGWSYEDWSPAFYPPGGKLKEKDWLAYYAEWFNCVEVNATYYTYLSQAVAAGWLRKIDESAGFLFTIKLHKDFTHKRDFSRQNVTAVTTLLSLLLHNERLGALLMQFPYSFTCNSANTAYLLKLNTLFSGYNCVVEFRHNSWNNNEIYGLLQENNLSWCSIDQPAVGKAIPFTPILTSGTLYLRLHGRNEEAWKQSVKYAGAEQSYAAQSARYDYLYSPSELIGLVNELDTVRHRVKEMFIIANNHPGGKAVVNALELMYYLNEKVKVKVPPVTVNAFPRLTSVARQQQIGTLNIPAWQEE